MTHAFAPSANRFASTFAAPPRCVDSRCTSTTGTGASGEMRDTLPQTNSSSITSPTTTTLRSLACLSSSDARCLSKLAVMVAPTDGVLAKPQRAQIQQSIANSLFTLPYHALDCPDHAFHRHAPNAFRFFKLGAEITVTWLAGHFFEYY